MFIPRLKYDIIPGMTKAFTHLDKENDVTMVDVSHKVRQLRIAVACGHIRLAAETLERIREQKIVKGNVLTTAKIAGIMAAKKTSELIPLCHPINLEFIGVDFSFSQTGITATSTVKAMDVTGVEMEALSAVSVSLLTIYDMCKAIDKQMVMGEVRLLSKEKHDLSD